MFAQKGAWLANSRNWLYKLSIGDVNPWLSQNQIRTIITSHLNLAKKGFRTQRDWIDAANALYGPYIEIAGFSNQTGRRVISMSGQMLINLNRAKHATELRDRVGF